AHAAMKEYIRALEDFRNAERLGHAEASLQLWSTTMSMAQEKQEAQPIASLLIAMGYALRLSEESKGKIPLVLRKVDSIRLSYPLGILHGRSVAASAPLTAANDCDRLASNPFDPLRVVTDGIPIAKIDADAAITACTQAIRTAASEGRYYLNRARAWSKIADA